VKTEEVNWLKEMLSDMVDGLKNYPNVAQKQERKELHQERLRTIISRHEKEKTKSKAAAS
jgi:hypothetical protein